VLFAVVFVIALNCLHALAFICSGLLGVGAGIPRLGNLSLDWEFQQRLGKNLGN